MAHFAKIKNGVVTEVLVVDNEYEAHGEKYLHSLGLEGRWVQTSYNNNIRVKYAAIGDVYNEQLDRFEPPSPYPSWVWDEDSYTWVAPVPYPDDEQNYDWDEEAQTWVLTNGQDS